MRNVTLLSASLALALSAGSAAAQGKGQAGFDKLKTLVGEWEGQSEDGVPSRASYQLISGGTALMETYEPGGEPPMVTIYAVDGDRVALTHYCSANNQPRMESPPIEGEPQRLAFAFTGGTNLASADTPHIDSLVLTFEDRHRFTQKWSWKEAGKDHFTTVHFTRKK